MNPLYITVIALTVTLASYCSVSVGPSTRIGIKELHDVVLQPNDVPEYLSRTDDGVMQSERLKIATNGYGMFYEIREPQDLPANPIKVILSESILYDNSRAAGEALRSKPQQMVNELRSSGSELPVGEVEVGQIGEEAVAVKLDIVPLNDLQFDIVFRQGRVLGHLMLVASRQFGEDELLRAGEQLGAVMATRMQSLPDND